jgi:hypothetical protein
LRSFSFSSPPQQVEEAIRPGDDFLDAQGHQGFVQPGAQFALIGDADEPVREEGEGFFQRGRSLGGLFRLYALGAQPLLDGEGLRRERTGAALLLGGLQLTHHRVQVTQRILG